MISPLDLLSLHKSPDDYEFYSQIYDGLALPEMETVDAIIDMLPFGSWEEDMPLALRIWAALKLNGKIVDHVYEEDQVLF